MENKGIKELKEMVSFLALLINASDKATKNGLGIDDITLYMVPLMKAPEAFSGMADLKLEFKDLSGSEVAELNVLLAKELDLENDKIEGLVEKSISLLVKIVSLVNEIKGLKSA